MSADLLGTGIALVSVPRFELAVRRHGERLLDRLFRPGELGYALPKRTGLHSLAARLAAKWAARDALSCLGLERVPVREIEIVRGKGSPPSIEPRGETARRLGAWRIRLTTSLTHDSGWALATVWVEGTRGRARLSSP